MGDYAFCLHPFVAPPSGDDCCAHVDVESQGDEHPCGWSVRDHAHSTFITGEWLHDQDPQPAFEGYLFGYWNGWARWTTTRAVIERLIETHHKNSDDELPIWTFDGDVLVVHPLDADDDEIRIEPEGDLYDVSLGYVWEEVRYFPGATIQPYDLMGTALDVVTVPDLTESES